MSKDNVRSLESQQITAPASGPRVHLETQGLLYQTAVTLLCDNEQYQIFNTLRNKPQHKET